MTHKWCHQLTSSALSTQTIHPCEPSILQYLDIWGFQQAIQMQQVHFTPFLYKPFVSFCERFFNHATTFLTLRNITHQFNRMMVRDQWTSCVCMGVILIWNLGVRHYETCIIFCTQNRHPYLRSYEVSGFSILGTALYVPHIVWPHSTQHKTLWSYFMSLPFMSHLLLSLPHLLCPHKTYFLQCDSMITW